MTLRLDGDWHVGDDAGDLEAFLSDVGAVGYRVHEIRHCVCASCRAGVFGLRNEEDDEAVQRVCRGCADVQFVADSEEHWDDESMYVPCCACEGEDFELAVGYSLYANAMGIRSLAIAGRCVACGRMGVFGQWMIRGGEMHLLDQA